MKQIIVISILFISVNCFSQSRRNYSFEEILSSTQLEGKGSYDDGNKMTGEWEFFYSRTNSLHSVGKYKEGIKDGKWLTYYEDGTLAQEAELQQGMAVNKTIGYYPNGKLNYEWMFDHKGNKIVSIYYNQDGSVDFKLINDSINDLDIPYSYFYSKGLLSYEGFYSPFKGSGHNNLLDGIYYKYYSNNNIKEVVYYTDHHVSSKVEKFFKNGNLKSRTGTHKNLFNGDFIYYSKQGKTLLKVSYKDGKPIGKYLEYYSNGKLKIEKDYDAKGSLIGPIKRFKRNGIPK